MKKAGLDTNDLKNVRPVSNQPFILKILEKVVLLQLQSNFSVDNLLEIRQSAYRKKHSTETAVLRALEGLLTKSDQKLVLMLAGPVGSECHFRHSCSLHLVEAT